MIAAWASLITGWALTHPLAVIAILTALLVAAVALVVIPLIDAPEGRHHTPRPVRPPRRAGKARAWPRAALRTVRGLPGAIGWAWATPVRTRAPELHHERPLAAEDAATVSWLHSMRGLRHPGWTMLALRSRLHVLGALIASGRATPGHTAPQVHGEPGPAGTMLPNRGDAQGREGGCAPQEPRPAPGADLTGSLSPRQAPREGLNQERPGLVSAPPDPGTIARLRESPWPQDRSMADFYDPPDPGAAATGSSDGPAPSMPEPPTPVISAAPAFLAALPPPHDLALWQPTPLEYEHDTSWFTLPAIDADVRAGGAS